MIGPTLTTDDFLGDQAWFQPDFPPELRDGIASLIAFDESGEAVQLGTAFPIEGFDDNAIFLTAAHVVRAVGQFQGRYRPHQASALEEFLPRRRIEISPGVVRLLVSFEGTQHACRVVEVLWDDLTDVGFVYVNQPEEFVAGLLNCQSWISPLDPVVGGLIGTIGFDVLTTERTGRASGILMQRPVLRIGRSLGVDHRRTIGHSTALKTSIPFSSGMSGSPVFHYNESGGRLEVFGLASSCEGRSSDPADDSHSSIDFTTPASSTVTVLPRRVTPLHDGSQAVLIQFTADGSASASQRLDENKLGT